MNSNNKDFSQNLRLGFSLNHVYPCNHRDGSRAAAYTYTLDGFQFTVTLVRDSGGVVTAWVTDNWLKDALGNKCQYTSVDTALQACERFIKEKRSPQQKSNEQEEVVPFFMREGFRVLGDPESRCGSCWFYYEYLRTKTPVALYGTSSDAGWFVKLNNHHLTDKDGNWIKYETMEEALSAAKDKLEERYNPPLILPEGFACSASQSGESPVWYNYEYRRPEGVYRMSVKKMDNKPGKFSLMIFFSGSDSDTQTYSPYESIHEALEVAKDQIDNYFSDYDRKNFAHSSHSTTAEKKETTMSNEPNKDEAIIPSGDEVVIAHHAGAKAIQKVRKKAAQRKQLKQALTMSFWTVPSFVASKIVWPIARPIWDFATGRIITILFGLLCYTIAYYFGPSLPSPKTIVTKPIEWGGTAIELVSEGVGTSREATNNAFHSSKDFVIKAFDEAASREAIDINDPEALIARANELKKEKILEASKQHLRMTLEGMKQKDEYWRGYLHFLQDIFEENGGTHEGLLDGEYWKIRWAVVEKLEKRGYDQFLPWSNLGSGKKYFKFKETDLKFYHTANDIEKRTASMTIDDLEEVGKVSDQPFLESAQVVRATMRL